MSAAGRLLFALRGALLLEGLRRLLLALFLAIHTFAHDVSLHTADRSAVAKIRQKSGRVRQCAGCLAVGRSRNRRSTERFAAAFSMCLHQGVRWRPMARWAVSQSHVQRTRPSFNRSIWAVRRVNG